MMKVTGGSALLDAESLLKKAGVKDRAKVADFGSGAYGHFIFPAAQMVGKDGRVYAVDILKPALESINKKARQEGFGNVQTIWSDLEVFKAAKIEAESLDVGLLINNLYLSRKRPEILRECIRMIKKGGKLLVVEWEDTSSPFGPPAEERVKADLLKQAGEKLGLKVDESFSAGQYHYAVIFTKL
jgi:ubiquinone/menaquinone biosynthesis C-methylase UbiE